MCGKRYLHCFFSEFILKSVQIFNALWIPKCPISYEFRFNSMLSFFFSNCISLSLPFSQPLSLYIYLSLPPLSLWRENYNFQCWRVRSLPSLTASARARCQLCYLLGRISLNISYLDNTIHGEPSDIIVVWALVPIMSVEFEVIIFDSDPSHFGNARSIALSILRGTWGMPTESSRLLILSTAARSCLGGKL